MTKHAVERARERYGVHLSGSEMMRFARLIANGETILLHRERKRGVAKELHIIQHGGIDLPAMWCPETRAIVTFLPPECTEIARWPRETWGPRNDAMRACVVQCAEIAR